MSERVCWICGGPATSKYGNFCGEPSCYLDYKSARMTIYATTLEGDPAPIPKWAHRILDAERESLKERQV